MDGITVNDRHEATSQAWHGKSIVKAVILLKDSWLALWDIVKSPLFTLDDNGKPVSTDYCQLVASDNKSIAIGKSVSTKTFSPITNASFLAIVSEALNDIAGSVVVSVGSVCNRCRVFVTLQLTQQVKAFEAAGREFKPYLNFLNSHDQSAPFAVVVSFVCTVCNNTFGMNLYLVESDLTGIKAAMKRNELRIKLKHTKNVAERLANVPDVIRAFHGTVAIFKATMEYLGKTAIEKHNVVPLFTGFLNNDMPEGLVSLIMAGTKLDQTQTELVQISTRRKNQIERLADLHLGGKGNNGATLADAFSAITDYYTHESSGGMKEDADAKDIARQIETSEYGTGQESKERGLRLLADADAVANAIAFGRRLLEVQTKE